MTLAQTPDNPMPADPIAGLLPTPDGAIIRYARWRTKSHPVKGTILLLHGRAEYIEKLYETVTDMQKRGFDVVTFDWRGQGGSSRLLRDTRRGYIDSFDQYIMDLNTIMEEIVLPDCPGPFYIVAHSTGSLVALLAAPGFGNRIRRMVLSAPLLRLGEIGFSQETVKFFSGLLTTIGLGEIYLPGSKEPGQQPFIGNKLTSDATRFKRNQNFAEAHPELIIGGPTATWLFAAIKAMECLDDPEYHGHITIPTLLICAGSDQIVSSKAIELLGRRLRSGSALTIDGARHELFQERDIYREQLLSAFEAFIPGTELA